MPSSCARTRAGPRRARAAGRTTRRRERRCAETSAAFGATAWRAASEEDIATDAISRVKYLGRVAARGHGRTRVCARADPSRSPSPTRHPNPTERITSGPRTFRHRRRISAQRGKSSGDGDLRLVVVRERALCQNSKTGFGAIRRRNLARPSTRRPPREWVAKACGISRKTRVSARVGTRARRHLGRVAPQHSHRAGSHTDGHARASSSAPDSPKAASFYGFETTAPPRELLKDSAASFPRPRWKPSRCAPGLPACPSAPAVPAPPVPAGSAASPWVPALRCAPDRAIAAPPSLARDRPSHRGFRCFASR